MRAKKARAEKTLLSRQEIVHRKKGLSERKYQSDLAGKPVLAGVFLLTLSLLVLLSLTSFNLHDRTGPGFKNLIGPIGHRVADALLPLWGFCAYLLPLAGLYT